MTVKDWAIPVATVVFAAGVSFASLESAAQEAEDLSKRVTVLESESGKKEVVDIKIQGVEKRLDKMEPLTKQRSARLPMRVATNETCTA